MTFRLVYIIVLVFACINVVIIWYQVNQIQPSTSTFLVCDCDRDRKLAERQTTHHLVTTLASTSSSTHRLAVIVPFRDRYDEMIEFVPHMHAFLQRQEVDHQIWIINQVDNHRLG